MSDRSALTLSGNCRRCGSTIADHEASSGSEWDSCGNYHPQAEIDHPVRDQGSRVLTLIDMETRETIHDR